MEDLKQAILAEKETLEKWINDKFDNLSLKAKRKQLTRAFSNPRYLRFINALYQLRLNNPFLIGADTKVRDSLIEHFVLTAYAGSVYGYENARVLRLNMNEMLEFIPSIGMLEDRLGFIIKYIEEDDSRKICGHLSLLITMNLRQPYPNTARRLISARRCLTWDSL